MDPFIPINVPDYSDKEAYSCVEYFINRRWILNPKGMSTLHYDDSKLCLTSQMAAIT
jgi:hypothetical protein